MWLSQRKNDSLAARIKSHILLYKDDKNQLSICITIVAIDCGVRCTSRLSHKFQHELILTNVTKDSYLYINHGLLMCIMIIEWIWCLTIESNEMSTYSPEIICTTNAFIPKQMFQSTIIIKCDDDVMILVTIKTKFKQGLNTPPYIIVNLWNFKNEFLLTLSNALDAYAYNINLCIYIY